MQKPLRPARNIRWPLSQTKKGSFEKKTASLLSCMCSIGESDGEERERANQSPSPTLPPLSPNRMTTSLTTSATFTLLDKNNNAKKRAAAMAAKLNGISLETEELTLVFNDEETQSSDSLTQSSRGSSEPKTSDLSSESGEEDENSSLRTLPPMDYPPMLQDLEAVCTIGTGTFGRVQLTRHRDTKKHYALKILNMHKIVQTRQVEHVHNEKHILSIIEHPFIVKLHNTERDERNLYMIMEFVPGGELFSYLRAARRFSLQMATFYAAEITSALAFLHSQNIVYRDLKPENLMLTQSGHIKMADFGFAKELRDRYKIVGIDAILDM
uniref:Protein kinase domain-containing protein n=1 Tax=Mesorhabditis belari TaxID=2138241 RepID=A0AAF3FK71_9BILA